MPKLNACVRTSRLKLYFAINVSRFEIFQIIERDFNLIVNIYVAVTLIVSKQAGM